MQKPGGVDEADPLQKLLKQIFVEEAEIGLPFLVLLPGLNVRFELVLVVVEHEPYLVLVGVYHDVPQLRYIFVSELLQNRYLTQRGGGDSFVLVFLEFDLLDCDQLVGQFICGQKDLSVGALAEGLGKLVAFFELVADALVL